jgi:peptidoglycan-associated lipoprotein
MSKLVSYYAISVIITAVFLIVGCAKQDVVKKDDGIMPTPDIKQSESLSKSSAMSTSEIPPIKPATTQITKVDPVLVPVQQPPHVSTIKQLNSALDRIYFDSDSATLSESSRNKLVNNAAVLTRETSSLIRIEGNCDERGSAEYNMALGERRAKAAQQYLVTLGVKSDSLSIVSYGKEKPAVQGNDEAAWSKNRRDEFIVLNK